MSFLSLISRCHAWHCRCDYCVIIVHCAQRGIFEQVFEIDFFSTSRYLLNSQVLYDRLTDGHMDNLRGHIHGSQLMPSGKLCHFTENHDEDRAAAHFAHRALAAAAVSLTMPGPRLLMWGQELGLKARLAVHLRRAVDEPTDSGMQQALSGLLAALPSCRGTWKICGIHGDSSWRLVAWGWKCPAATSVFAAIVVANFTDAEAWGNVQIGEFLPDCDCVKLADALSGQAYERSIPELRGPNGLVVGLQPYQSHVFLCSTK